MTVWFCHFSHCISTWDVAHVYDKEAKCLLLNAKYLQISAVTLSHHPSVYWQRLGLHTVKKVVIMVLCVSLLSVASFCCEEFDGWIKRLFFCSSCLNSGGLQLDFLGFLLPQNMHWSLQSRVILTFVCSSGSTFFIKVHEIQRFKHTLQSTDPSSLFVHVWDEAILLWSQPGLTT